jgi:hypothetical protein
VQNEQQIWQSFRKRKVQTSSRCNKARTLVLSIGKQEAKWVK